MYGFIYLCSVVFDFWRVKCPKSGTFFIVMLLHQKKVNFEPVSTFLIGLLQFLLYASVIHINLRLCTLFTELNSAVNCSRYSQMIKPTTSLCFKVFFQVLFKRKNKHFNIFIWVNSIIKDKKETHMHVYKNTNQSYITFFHVRC